MSDRNKTWIAVLWGSGCVMLLLAVGGGIMQVRAHGEELDRLRPLVAKQAVDAEKLTRIEAQLTRIEQKLDAHMLKP